MGAAVLLAACRGSAGPLVPPGYPAGYADTIRAATAERQLLIWSAVDRVKARGLLSDFRARHPAIAVEYHEIPARQLTDRFLAAVAAHAKVPDIVWSSAMDLQIKLVNDGYAQTYLSPEATHVAEWANWKNQAWGTTAEPIVFVYNRQLIADAAMPRTHGALARYLEHRPPPPRGTVATYSLPNSAVGYLYFSQDQQATHGFWRIVRLMSVNGSRTFRNAEDILGDVEAGRSAIGYDIIGSYAAGEVSRNANLGMILPRDYVLTVSRIAFISALAAHPNAARLFIDFLLSRSGQRHLVAQLMPSVRSDIPPPRALDDGQTPRRAIRVGPGLLVDSDQLTRAHELRRWRNAISAVEPAS